MDEWRQMKIKMMEAKGDDDDNDGEGDDEGEGEEEGKRRPGDGVITRDANGAMMMVMMFTVR